MPVHSWGAKTQSLHGTGCLGLDMSTRGLCFEKQESMPESDTYLLSGVNTMKGPSPRPQT